MNKFLYMILVAQFAISNKKFQQTADNTNLHIGHDRIFTPDIINAADTLEMLLNQKKMVFI